MFSQLNGRIQLHLPATEDVNSIFSNFHTKLTEIIDNHVPLRKR